ncbi:MAG: NusG domain II-containing protein [Peptococcaceae bacterium]|nr:NusG domain II-containing protein [Peptococcaceae bacterium]
MLKYDKLILALILLSAIGLWGFFCFWQNRPEQNPLTAVVQTPGERLMLDMEELESAGQEKHWQVEGALGRLEIVYVPDRGFAITESGCPDQICVRSGYISVAGQSLICVPNQVLIRLEEKAESQGREGLDGVLR